jgi:catechol 2,3-dioxygenase-like lactoylglutathione lyase family enzyme
MAKVIPGNHSAVFAARSEQDRIRKFYCDVLGCKVRVKTDEVDRFQLDDFYFCFVWQTTALDESSFLKSIFLELMTDNTEEMRQTILAFGAKKVDVPDPHFYFQAPGGQVFKLVGISEDLSKYEESSSSRPGSSASARDVKASPAWKFRKEDVRRCAPQTLIEHK